MIIEAVKEGDDIDEVIKNSALKSLTFRDSHKFRRLAVGMGFAALNVRIISACLRLPR